MQLDDWFLEWALQGLKGKNFVEFTDDECAMMILSNHPLYRAHKEIEQDIKDECAMLESMTEEEKEVYFAAMEKVDGEWDV